MKHNTQEDTVEIVSDIEVTNVQLQVVEVVGLQFYEYAAIAQDLIVGEELQLQHEAWNEHDRKAIAIYYRDHKIGFVAKEQNHLLHQLMDKEIPLTAYILDHNMNNGYMKGQQRLMAQVYMPYTFLITETIHADDLANAAGRSIVFI